MDTKISLNLIKNWNKIISEVNFEEIAAPLLQQKIISVDEYKRIVSGNENSFMESCLLLLLKREEQVLLEFAEILKKDYSWLSGNLMEGYLTERDGIDETDASPIISMDVTDDMRSRPCIQNGVTSSNNIINQCNSNSFNSSSPLLCTNIKNKGNIRRKKNKKPKVKNKVEVKLKNSSPTISSTTSILTDSSLNETVTDEVISIIRKSPLVSKSWTTIAHSLGLTDRVHEIRYKVIIHGEDLSMCVVYLIKDWLEMFSESAKLSKLIEVLRCEGFNNVSDKLSEILHGKKNGVLSTIP